MDEATPRQALVITLGTGMYSQNSSAETRLNWPFHYVAYLGPPPFSPVHYVFGQPEARGTR